MPGYKTSRTAEDLKRELTLLIRELKDPRVQHLLTVVRVEVSTDASFARVYISALEGMDATKQAVKGLESATGLLRREVGNKLHMRKAPELKFIADDSTNYAIDIAKKLDKLKEDRNED